MDELRDKLLIERDLDIGFLTPGVPERVVRDRMQRLRVAEVEDYVRALDDDPGEYTDLLRDLLRPPDRFFADEALTSLLRHDLLPTLFERKNPGDRVRIWVPNAGEGYLGYDIAMLIRRMLDGNADAFDIKVIVTDPDEERVNTARFQRFPEERFDDLRRDGWPVVRVKQGLRIDPDIRKLLVVGVHNPVQDPPYPRIDLIVCGGLIPMLDPEQRGSVTSRMVYSLSVNGRLVLGRGEVFGLQAEQATSERPFAVFTKQVPHPFEIASPGGTASAVPDAHQGILERLHWPAIVVEQGGRIVHANGPASRDLAGGEDLEGKSVADLRLSTSEREAILKTVGDSIEEARPVAILKIDGWNGSTVPLKGGGRKLAAVVLVPAEAAPPADQPGIEAAQAARAEVAREAVETVAEMWAYDREIQRLREQAASMTDALYIHTQQLGRVRRELESRNVEMSVANQELKDAMNLRARVESDLRVALEREHRIADTLQKVLLTPIPERIEGFEIAARYQAARQIEEADVAGDFYHAGWLPDGRFFLVLGDVAGKGLEAAVFAYQTKYMLLAYAHESPRPNRVLARLNEALIAHGEGDRFVTVAYLLIDIQTGRIDYGSGGHEPALVCRPDGTEPTVLDPTGPILGVVPGAEYGSRTVEMATQGSLLIYTDGLSEAGHRTRALGTDGIADLLAKHCADPGEAFLDVLYETALSVSGGTLTDDATALIIKRTAD